MKKILSLLLLWSVTKCAFANNLLKTDSLITEYANNLVYVKHKVVEGETLYSLLKKYNCSSAEVLQINPSLNGNSGIKTGQTLKFPLIVNGKHVSATIHKEKNLNKTIQGTDNHTVKAGETIFSLSKLYKIDISDFVIANQITDNKIKIGQKLVTNSETIANLVKKHREAEKQLEAPKPVGQKHSYEGLAEVINTNNRTTKLLAMHRDAPVGSTIKITNEANGYSVFARVVGHLKPFGADQDIMVKLSPYAYYGLRPKDSRIRAKVEYYTP